MFLNIYNLFFFLCNFMGIDEEIDNIGFIGLGKMGYQMAFRLLEKGREVIAYDLASEPVKALAEAGARPADSLQKLVSALPSPQVNWLMVPKNQVDPILDELAPLLRTGDIVIDGGNSWYPNSIRRYHSLHNRGIHFLDVGISGGPLGARQGASLMIGGDQEIFEKMKPLFRDLAVPQGYAYVGGPGAGHYVKAVHNAIEYGMMAALAEGMRVLRNSPLSIDLQEASRTYAHGSIIQGHLTELVSAVYKHPEFLDSLAGIVPPGETEAEMELLDLIVGMPILQAARQQRVSSRSRPTYEGKVIAALRSQFGGHAVIMKEERKK